MAFLSRRRRRRRERREEVVGLDVTKKAIAMFTEFVHNNR